MADSVEGFSHDFGEGISLYDGSTDGFPSTCFEVPHSAKRPPPAHMREAFHPDRHKAAKIIYVVKPAAVQCYLTHNLHEVVHYNLSAQDVPKLLDIEGPRIVVVGPTEDYSDQYISVRNNHPEDLKNPLPVKDMMQFLLNTDKKADRNHRRIDLGCTGHNNSTRDDPDSLGLAKPHHFVKTFTAIGQAILLAMNATLLNVFPECAGCTYDDPERNAMFAERYCPGSRIESAAGVLSTFEREGVAINTDYLMPHTDNLNDSTNPAYAAVIGKSVLVRDNIRNTVDRCGGVGYGKHAASQYLERYHRYRDILRYAFRVWEGLPMIEKEVDLALFPNPSKEPEGKYLANPHTQKTVYYSSFRHAIWMFSEAYDKLSRQPLLLPGLLFCVTVSPAPQHYYYELKRVMEDPGIFAEQGHPSVADMDARDFTQCFYDHLFEAKSQPQAYRTVNRHQPSHNKRAKESQLDNSIDVIARLLYELHRVPAETMRRQIGYYHSRALAVLRQGCPKERINVWEQTSNSVGVYNAGSLTAQHILGVAAGVGAVPECLLTYAEIASGTSSWSFLASFGLDEDKFVEHSETILAAISNKLGIHRVQAEELCCATNQVVSKTKDRPSEWIPLGAPLLRCLPPPNRRRSEGPRDADCPLVELLFPNGHATVLPPYPMNFHDAFFQPGPGQSGAYWNIKIVGYKLTGKKYRQKRGPQAADYFPLITPPGFTVNQAKAEGLYGVPIPSYKSVIFCRNRLTKLVADVDDGVRYVLGRFYRNENLNLSEDVVIFVVDERLLKLDHNRKPLCVVSKREPPPHRIIKRQRREGVRPPDRAVYVTVYAYAIKLGGGKLFRPKPDFPLRDDYFLKDERSSYRDLGTRYFKTKQEAKHYCCLSFLATADPTTSFNLFRSCPGLGDKPVIVPRYADGAKKGGRGGSPRKAKARKRKEEDCEEEEAISEVRVHVYTTRPDRSSQVPRYVSVTYESGARAFFLTNESGVRVSGLMFLLPFPSLGEKGMYEMILAHRGERAETELYVSWLDGSRSWESIGSFEGRMDWPVLKYAQCLGLLGEPNWKRFAGMEARLPELSMPAVEI